MALPGALTILLVLLAVPAVALTDAPLLDAGGAVGSATGTLAGVVDGATSSTDVLADPVAVDVELESPVEVGLGISAPAILAGDPSPASGAPDAAPASESGDNGGRGVPAAGGGSMVTTGLVVALPVAGLGLAGFLPGLKPVWSPRLIARVAAKLVRLAMMVPAALPALPAFALFSRLQDRELKDNPVRAQLLQMLEDNPGLSMQEMQERAEVAWGTVVYHLERLEKARHVVSHRDGRHRRYWLEADPEARMRQEASILRGETPKAIADAIAAHPGLHQGAVCARLQLAAPTASKYLKRLTDAGLIRVVPESKRRLYFPTERLRDVAAVGEASLASTRPAAVTA